jgi:hypothetical protein
MQYNMEELQGANRLLPKQNSIEVEGKSTPVLILLICNAMKEFRLSACYFYSNVVLTYPMQFMKISSVTSICAIKRS